MKLHELANYAVVSALALAPSPSVALDFSFSFTNTIGNTAGTVTGVVKGLLNNATTAATDVIITSYPSAMTGLPPAPFSVLKLPYTSLIYNSFPVYNGQVQYDGNLGHGLFEFGSSNSYSANYDFCMSGFGFATEPCQPPAWFSSWTEGYYNIRHVMTNDIVQFTPLAAGAPSIPGTFTITFNFVPGQPSPSLLPIAPSVPGTFATVPGNLLFEPGASYSISLNPSSTTYAVVSGTASLAGTVQAQFLPGSYKAKQYDILKSAGLGGTTFGALITSNLPPNFIAGLSYTPTDVFLNLTAALGAGGSLSRNQQNAANAINDFFNNGGELPPAFTNLFNLTGGNLGTALTQLSGEAATGAQQGAFQLGSQFLNTLVDPFVDGRSGVAGSGGPALGFAPQREALPEDVALAYARATKTPAYNKAPPLVPAFEPRWTAWGSAYGGYNTTSGDAVVGTHDLTARAGGVAGGADYRLTPDSVVGFAVAGGATNWSVAPGLGGGNSDAFQAGAYAATRSGPAYLAASAAFTNYWMSTDRFAAFGDHLTAKFEAQSLGGRIEGGYRFDVAGFGLTPYAAVQAQSFRTPSYSETDLSAGGFGLTYAGRTATDTRGEVGARFDHVAAVTENAVITFRSRLGWVHDWVSDPSLFASFQTLPGASFIVNGAGPAKDAALASVGAELRLARGVTLLARFDGEFANHAQTYAGTGTLRYSW